MFVLPQLKEIVLLTRNAMKQAELHISPHVHSCRLYIQPNELPYHVQATDWQIMLVHGSAGLSSGWLT